MNDITTNTAQQLTQTDVGNGIEDLNRIINSPNAENVESLKNLRDKMSLNQSRSRSSLPEDDPKRELRAQRDRRVQVSFFRNPSDKFVIDTQGQYNQPFGLRNTPKTHINTELISPKKQDKNVFDPTPVRFENAAL